MRRFRRWRWRRIGVILATVVVAVLVGGNVAWSNYTANLPAVDNMASETLSQVTRIYASDATTLLEERFSENRQVVPLDRIGKVLQEATVAVEDRGFYNHGGYDLPRVVGAAIHDLTQGDSSQGASTITMQVVKNTVLPPEPQARSLDWKLKELVLASQLETRYSKAEILGFYLNSIYYGRSAYGAEAAAEAYFGHSARDLTLAEASFLAGLPQSPARYDTATAEGLAAARDRQHVVLDAMVNSGKASATDATAAAAVDLQGELDAAAGVPNKGRVSVAPHFVDFVLDQLRRQLGDQAVARGGLTVVTTLSPRAQQAAEKAVVDEVAAVGRATPTIPRDADGQPASGPNNGAALVISPQTGAILAMVGSRDYGDASINGARNMTVDEPRQVGSSFKPYTYATALATGYTPGSVLQDANPNFASDPSYHPHDFDSRQMGAITLATSLQQSRNISSVHLFEAVGASRVFATAETLGIPPQYLRSTGLSATLGTNEMRMLDHVAAYGAFGNGGRRVSPWAIVRISDGQGRVIQDYSPHPLSPGISPSVAATLTGILKGAVPSNYGLTIPVAAKSGTTEAYTDAWFIGYTTDLVVGAWMGRTDQRSARLHMNRVYGEVSAGLIMRDFLKAWYVGGRPADFIAPPVPSACGRGFTELPAPAPAVALAGSVPTAPYQYASPLPAPSNAPATSPSPRTPPSPRPCSSPAGSAAMDSPPPLPSPVPPATILPLYSPPPAATPAASPAP